ncbi:hypothetical protein B0H19DRAFT_1266681 [Mycena capillaripes]|nr:hypothetical protein B0H19DRAFT_1266681 [Mycena capillaripes]
MASSSSKFNLSVNPTSTLATVLTAFGSLIATYYAYQLLCFLYLYFLHRSTISRYLASESSALGNHSWALITGASGGIGLGFAQELASRGFNIILHGRSPTKLAAVETALKAQFPHISIRLFVIDVYPCSAPTIDELVRGLANDGLRVRVLVNNVGGGAIIKPTFRSLTRLSAVDVHKFLDLNIGFPTMLTRALLPVMQEPALVLNVGSSVASVPAPWITVYGASKAFNMAWSRSLGVELRAEGKSVEVMALVVGEVQSSGHPVPEGPLVCSSRTLARSALDRVGCGRHIVAPWWRHAVIMALIDCLPNVVLDRIMMQMNTALMDQERDFLEAEKRSL